MYSKKSQKSSILFSISAIIIMFSATQIANASIVEKSSKKEAESSQSIDISKAIIKNKAELQNVKLKKQNKSKPASFELQDNDVYLFTPKAWETMQRLRNGEYFDVDAELDRQISEKPYVFSLYYFAGIIKVRRLMLEPHDKRDDKKIEWLFETCLAKAKNAQRYEKYRTAGLFYEAVCGSGLGLFHGVRGNYLRARSLGVKSMDAIDQVFALRPNLEGALLLKGIYNYFTGRFGFFTRLLLRLVGLPAGDYELGRKQVIKAVKRDGPFNFFTTIYAVYLLAPSGRFRNDAFKMADSMVKTYPENYYSWLMRGYVYIKMRKFDKALKDNIKGRSLLRDDLNSYNDIVYVADGFLLDSRIAYTRAILYNDYEGLKYLNKWANNHKSHYADAPLLACMYLGHLNSFAGLDDTALKFYQKMQDFNDAEWMKDIGKNYEKMPIGKRYRLKKQVVENLRKFLLAHPEIKP